MVWEVPRRLSGRPRSAAAGRRKPAHGCVSASKGDSPHEFYYLALYRWSYVPVPILAIMEIAYAW